MDTFKTISEDVNINTDAGDTPHQNDKAQKTVGHILTSGWKSQVHILGFHFCKD